MHHPPLLLRQSDAGTGLSRIPEAYENGISKSGSMQPVDGEEDKLLHQCVDDVKLLKLLANKSIAP